MLSSVDLTDPEAEALEVRWLRAENASALLAAREREDERDYWRKVAEGGR